MQAGMVFDAGTWWLIGIMLTALLGVIGALISRSIFKRLDDNSADIKEVREQYTPRSQHAMDLKDIRQEMKELRGEVRGDIQELNENIKELRETCLRKDDFLRSMMQMQNKMDEIYKYLMEGGKHE